MTIDTRVGFGDTEAKPVRAFVLAETAEDFERFQQIISRGQLEYANEPGLSAAVLRQIDLKGVYPKAPVIGGPVSDWATGGNDKSE